MSRVNAWYINSTKGAEGPFATDLMRAMVRDQRLKPLDLVFREGDDEWRPASMFSELQPETADAEMAKAFRAAANLPDFTPSNSANSTSDGTEAGSGGAHAWIVLRPHGSTYLQEGPFKTEQIREGLKRGAFNFGQYAWHIGMSQWMRIGDLREFDRRSTPRERTPHVPPPLPDPITSVLLEDDGDFESEEFHVSVNPHMRTDLTPVDFFNLGKEAFAVGGAAAKSPERSEAFGSPPESSKDLAGVPWEDRFEQSGVFTQAVELIDDESSVAGVEARSNGSVADFDQGEDQDDVSSHTAYYEGPKPQEAPYVAVSKEPAIASEPTDGWSRWGRYASAAGFAFVAGTFVLHAATTPKIRVERQVVEAKPLISPEVDRSVAMAPEALNSAPAEASAVAADAVSPSTPVAPPSAPVLEVEIVGLKLQEPDASILLQGALPVGKPVAVTFRGRVGEVLGSLNVRKTVSVTRKGGEIPTVRLKELALPAGSYTVEVGLGEETVAKADIFVGKRDARFLDRLEAHLREHSYELQTQKKVLFYAAQELDVLARDLGLNYGQLRSRADLWGKFYQKWTAKVSAVEKSVSELGRREASEQAYPEEVERLMGLAKVLKETADQFQSGVGASRDVASDGLTDLIAELARQKTAIGAISVRPESGEPEPTSRGL